MRVLKDIQLIIFSYNKTMITSSQKEIILVINQNIQKIQNHQNQFILLKIKIKIIEQIM